MTFLIIALVLAVIFFISFPITKRFSLKKNYKQIYLTKCKRIARKNNYKILSKLNLKNLNGDNVIIDQILIGKKFIYLINDYCYFDILSGKISDNSWIHIVPSKKEANYVNNLLLEGLERICNFSRISKVDKKRVISISLMNNECDLRLNQNSLENSYIVKKYKLRKLVNKLEQNQIFDLYPEMIKEVIEEINEANE